MFWFKRKEVTLDFFTYSYPIYHTYPPSKAAKFMPEWFRSLPSQTEVRYGKESYKVHPMGTMKHCMGLKDLYGKGFVIPLWSDVKITVTPKEFHYFFADGKSSCTAHPPSQYGDNFKPFHHMKFISPWLADEKSGMKFLFCEPTWTFLNVSQNIRIIPGVVTYDVGTQTNVNVFLKKQEKEYSELLIAGTPFVHLIPLTENKVKLKTHLLNEVEWKERYVRIGPTQFVGNFNAHQKVIRSKKD